jgi:hypothetical protein
VVGGDFSKNGEPAGQGSIEGVRDKYQHKKHSLQEISGTIRIGCHSSAFWEFVQSL